MNWKNAVKLMEKGKRIRKKSWPDKNHYYFLENNGKGAIRQRDDNNIFYPKGNVNLLIGEVESKDWEEYK